MKQLIEIEIPDGYEYLDGIEYRPSWPTEEGECIEVVIFLMKKENNDK